MKERRLIDEKTGRDMQNWYIEHLRGAVMSADSLYTHLDYFECNSKNTDIFINQYEIYGVCVKIKEAFECLVADLLMAYEKSCGCDEFDDSLGMLNLLKHHDFDPEIVFEEIEEIRRKVTQPPEGSVDVEELEDDPLETNGNPKYPFALMDAVEKAKELEELAAEDAYHKTIKMLFDTLPDEPYKLKELIARCELKLESMVENPND